MIQMLPVNPLAWEHNLTHSQMSHRRVACRMPVALQQTFRIRGQQVDNSLSYITHKVGVQYGYCTEQEWKSECI